MDVDITPELPPERAAVLKDAERDYARGLQHDGRWRHLWRVAGQYANYSVFDVSDHDELHEVLSALPLFPYMDLVVTALARHPSAIDREADIEGGESGGTEQPHNTDEKEDRNHHD
jgi:muconolactone D-isomerase